MSSWSRTGSSPIWFALATTSVGARSSFGADSGPAASFSLSSASGPTTRKRHGFVRLWLGAQRASSNSSSSVSRSTASRVYALCVRRGRVACSTSMADLTLAGEVRDADRKPAAPDEAHRHSEQRAQLGRASEGAVAAAPPLPLDHTLADAATVARVQHSDHYEQGPGRQQQRRHAACDRTEP